MIYFLEKSDIHKNLFLIRHTFKFLLLKMDVRVHSAAHNFSPFRFLVISDRQTNLFPSIYFVTFYHVFSLSLSPSLSLSLSFSFIFSTLRVFRFLCLSFELKPLFFTSYSACYPPFFVSSLSFHFDCSAALKIVEFLNIFRKYDFRIEIYFNYHLKCWFRTSVSSHRLKHYCCANPQIMSKQNSSYI